MPEIRKHNFRNSKRALRELSWRLADRSSGTFTAVAAGWAHTCGLKNDATITCWGYNRYGQPYARSGPLGPVGVNRPTVTVTKGSPGPTEIGPGQRVPCAADTPTCRYINIELLGFAAGTYTVSCSHDGCTVASGQVMRIDSGRPRRPSQHTFNASASPRFRGSPSIVARCLATITAWGAQPRRVIAAFVCVADTVRR